MRKLKVNSQPEGMVCHDASESFFIGVEEEGIFVGKANQDSDSRLQMISGSSRKSNPNISYDIEGLAIYESNSNNYLIASVQGSFTYAIFDLGDLSSIKYKTSFKIKDGVIDGVEETDGLDICSFSLGKDFPKGMIVVQDGFNYDGDTKKSQNFKLVSWEDVELHFR